MKRVLALGAIGMILTGCQSSGGVLPAGPNTYMVTEVIPPIAGGGPKAQRTALTEADAYCKQQARVFVPDRMAPAGDLSNALGPTGYTVVFRCLDANDPAVASYRLQHAPDTTVEIRDR